MKNLNIIPLILVLVLLASSLLVKVNSEVGVQVNKEGDDIIYEDDIAFISRQLRIKHQKERKDLKGKFKKEREDLFNRLENEKGDLLERLKREEGDLSERIDRERDDFDKKLERELKELKRKHKEEVEEEINERKVDRLYRRRSRQGLAKNNKKDRITAREAIKLREKDVKDARRTERFVEISTNLEDPLFISFAEVAGARTEFMRVKNTDIEFKVKLINQTPKIINTAQIVWERKVPYSETITTITAKKNISKPIVPYETRIIKYNELDTKRDGELYNVHVSYVTFEDGSRWNNPLLAKN